jgi:hypothetical protein
MSEANLEKLVVSSEAQRAETDGTKQSPYQSLLGLQRFTPLRISGDPN